MLEFAWHVHHKALVEPLTEPIETRREYIRTNKPAEEQELRLRLLKPVKGKLPDEIVQAGEAYGKAWAAYTKGGEAHDKAWAAYTKAGEACDKALETHMPAILALHAIECPDCPWDGHTIFPELEE